MIECNLDKIIIEKGISKYALAKNTGISAHAIKNLCENKTISISFDTLTKLCDYLNVSVGDILENIKDDDKEKAED